MTSVGLLWHDFGSSNLGVEALSLSSVRALEIGLAGRRDCPFELVTVGGESVHGWPEGGPAIAVERRTTVPALVGQGRLAEALGRCEFVVDLGEGDSFAGIYGPGRFRAQSLSKVAALRQDVPLILAPQTIGPFTTAVQRHVAKRLLQRADAVFARDLESLGAISTLAPAAQAFLSSDLAFLLPADPPDLADATGPRIGVNVSGLLWNTDSKSEVAIEGYREMVVNLVRALTSHSQCFEVHLVPHVLGSHKVDNDLIAIRELSTLCDGVIVAPEFASAVEAKGYIGQLDAFVGSRMHATIAAVSSGVATVPWAYSRKFSGLFRSLGYDFVLEPRNSTPQELVGATLELIEQRETLKLAADRAAALALVRIDSYVGFLRSLGCAEC